MANASLPAAGKHTHRTMPAIVGVMLAMALGLCSGCSSQPTEKVRLATTLMSCNVAPVKAGAGWKKRKAVLEQIIRDLDPDVIGFQEPRAIQRQTLAKSLTRYVPWNNEKGRGPGGSQEGNPIFYKKDKYTLDPEESCRFWLSATPEVEASVTWNNDHIRICEVVRLVEKQTGKGFYVFNSHWSYSSKQANVKGAELILKRMKARKYDEPVVLMGDFNATESHKSIRLVKGPNPYHALVDSYRVLHPDEKQVGTYGGFKGKTDSEKIDYIFVDPRRTRVLDAEIIRTQIKGVYPSDHYPLSAKVVFEYPAN